MPTAITTSGGGTGGQKRPQNDLQGDLSHANTLLLTCGQETPPPVKTLRVRSGSWGREESVRVTSRGRATGRR